MGEEAVAFLDTSLLVRYLTDDPPELAERAAEIIESDERFVISELVLVESAYVLTSVYRVPRAAVVEALGALVQRRNLAMLNLSKPRTLEALSLCRDSTRISFADALQWALATEVGPARVYTFDRRFPSRGIVVES